MAREDSAAIALSFSAHAHRRSNVQRSFPSRPRGPRGRLSSVHGPNADSISSGSRSELRTFIDSMADAPEFSNAHREF